ncbi:hypothetical protein MPER_12958, partial [Moniliophthora perniciosa FA553]
NPEGEITKGAIKKRFTMINYKTHALGHYVHSIKYYGTTDLTLSSSGEKEHRRSKKAYTLTNKNRYEPQIGDKVMRKRQIHRMEENEAYQREKDNKPFVSTPHAHYLIANSRRDPIVLRSWMKHHQDDPGFHGFREKLVTFLLPRLRQDFDLDELTDMDILQITFTNDTIFRHRSIKINYMAYDQRCLRDSVLPRTHADIMMLSGNDSHPYLYGRVIGVYHATVMDVGVPLWERKPVDVDFLYVRWYKLATPSWSWSDKRLPKLQFVHCTDPDAFGFVDPADVIRGVHIIPSFNEGATDEFLPPDSNARVMEVYVNGEWQVETSDWCYYYVNIFVDRNIFIRFRGGGIGHKSTFHATKLLENDARKDDEPLPRYDDYGEVVEEIDNDIQEDATDSEEDDDFESGDEGPRMEVNAEDEHVISDLDEEDSEDTESDVESELDDERAMEE